MDKDIFKIPKRSCAIGGEALIEGVMMRGKDTVAYAIRKESGEIVIEKNRYIPIGKRIKILGIPFIRGAVSLFESMIIGMKAMMASAEYVDIEEEEPSKFEKALERIFGDKLFQIMIYISVIVALVFGIGLFMLLPNFITSFLSFDKTTTGGVILANLIEGILRIGIFLGYLILISRMKDIQRVFQYHGAEHKTIYCYEDMQELTVENAKKYTTLHPRCGTAFLFIVMLISIIIFTFAGWSESRLVMAGIRLLLLPVIAGVSYEILKISGKSKSKIVRYLSVPGLLLQKLTTKEPDEKQLEVAIASFKAVLEGCEETTTNECRIDSGVQTVESE